MEDFKNYIPNDKNNSTNAENNNGSQTMNGNLINLITSLAGKYNGASENELLRAIYAEAEKGFRNGTLKNEDLDKFANMLAPMLEPKKRAKLFEVVNKLKHSVK